MPDDSVQEQARGAATPRRLGSKEGFPDSTHSYDRAQSRLVLRGCEGSREACQFELTPNESIGLSRNFVQDLAHGGLCSG